MKKSLIRFFLLGILLLPQVLSLNFSLFVYGEAQSERAQPLLTRNDLKITATQQVNWQAGWIQWQFAYYQQASPGNKQALKFCFSEKLLQDMPPDWESSNNWWRQKNFKEESAGILSVKTAITTRCLLVRVQVDQQQTEGEIIENTLTAKEEGPYEVLVEGKSTSTTSSSQRAESSLDSSSVTSISQSEITSESLPMEDSAEFTSDSSWESLEKFSAEETMESTSKEEPPPLIGPVICQSTSGRLAAVTDPFSYTTDALGSFPSHFSQHYLGGGGQINASIKNYDYGSPSAIDNVKEFRLTTPGATIFEQGYHEYGSPTAGQVNTKKSVKATADPNVFEITVDTIGDALLPKPKVDLVLVLDKSNSMNKLVQGSTTRWHQLQAGVGDFVSGILEAELDLQIALVGFHATADFINHVDLALMKDKNANNMEEYTSENFFSNNKTTILTQSMLKDEPSTTAATPIYLGIDGAVYALGLTENDSDRGSAAKIICTITDGLPTYSPTLAYSFQANAKQSLARLDFGSVGNLKRSFSNGNRQYYTGIGNLSSEADQANTLALLNKRKREVPTYKWYAIGFHIGNEPNAVVANLGSNGTFFANDGESLAKALYQSLATQVETISQGTLFDPLSEHVSYVANSLQITPLTVSPTGSLQVDAVGTKASVEEIIGEYEGEERRIKLSNVTLGKVGENRAGLRVTYQVTLNKEDGKFYPLNETTYLQNEDGRNFYYAIPSARIGEADPLFDPVDVTLTKRIFQTEIPLAGARFSLYQEDSQTPVKGPVMTNSQGQLTFTDVLPGNYWLKEIESPLGYQKMAAIGIRIDEFGQVISPEITNNCLYNHLLPFSVRLNKVADGKPLVGASFELQKKNSAEIFVLNENQGLHQVTGLTAGNEYDLYETQAPPGYSSKGKIGTLRITSSGNATFNGADLAVIKGATENQLMLPDVENEPQQFSLKITKLHEDIVLAGAVFSLWDKNPVVDSTAEEINRGTSNNQGLVIFEQEKSLQISQSYYLKEVKAPVGYRRKEGIYQLDITKSGEILLIYQEMADELVTFELQGSQKNIIAFTVENKPKTTLPQTGGPGVFWLFLLGGIALFSVFVIDYFQVWQRQKQKN